MCGFACGKYLEKRIKRKGDFFSDLSRYLTLLKVNIEGRQVELEEFNREFCTNSSSVFREYIQNGKVKCALSSAQKDSISAFFSHLDCVSTQELVKHIEYYSYVFSTENKLVEAEVTKASIYVKLGILLGVMVGIVLM